MDFGTFLLMPLPELRPSAEVLARDVDFAQAADELGFRGRAIIGAKSNA